MNDNTNYFLGSKITLDEETDLQVDRISRLPILGGPVAIMPDAHLGKGATVGSVVFTRNAVIPANLGVDIGCGVVGARLSIMANELPSNLKDVRLEIEKEIPVGFNKHEDVPNLRPYGKLFLDLQSLYKRFDNVRLASKIKASQMSEVWKQLASLGGGNHFLEVSMDKEKNVWLVIHSGSRGIGNKLAQIAIDRAKEIMVERHVYLEDKDLAWLDEGSVDFDEYVEAVSWSQDYAALNRKAMLYRAITALNKFIPNLSIVDSVISCHHNYTEKETHRGHTGWLTRKGAIKAGKNDLGIIPGSMGTKTYIVRGKGNSESYNSCSHGAGRQFSRGEAKRRFTQDDLIHQTEGVECRKDSGIIDEIPSAYKNIDDVMEAQSELVEVVHTLKQVLCVKG